MQAPLENPEHVRISDKKAEFLTGHEFSLQAIAFLGREADSQFHRTEDSPSIHLILQSRRDCDRHST